MTEERLQQIIDKHIEAYEDYQIMNALKDAVNETIEEMITQTVVQIGQQKLGIAQKVFDIKTLEGTHEMLLNKKIP